MVGTFSCAITSQATPKPASTEAKTPIGQESIFILWCISSFVRKPVLKVMDQKPTNQSPAAFKIASRAEFPGKPRTNGKVKLAQVSRSGVPVPLKTRQRSASLNWFPSVQPRLWRQAETRLHWSAGPQAVEQEHPRAIPAKTLWCTHREPMR